MKIPALILAGVACVFLASAAGRAFDRGDADGRDAASPPLIDVRPIEGWLEASWNARSLEPTVPHSTRCEALGALKASCALEVLYKPGLFSTRTVALDVSCERARAAAADCYWFEL